MKTLAVSSLAVASLCLTSPARADAGLTAKPADPFVCSYLKAMAGIVNTLFPSRVMYIDPATGDLYVGGTTSDDLVYDCPPYVTS